MSSTKVDRPTTEISTQLNDLTSTRHARRFKLLYVDLAVTGHSKKSIEANTFSLSSLSHEIRMHTLVCNNRLVDRKATKKTHWKHLKPIKDVKTKALSHATKVVLQNLHTAVFESNEKPLAKRSLWHGYRMSFTKKHSIGRQFTWAHLFHLTCDPELESQFNHGHFQWPW